MTEAAVAPRPAATLPGQEIVPDMLGHMVGPFALLATHGPMELPPGFPHAFDIRPHPHTGAGILACLLEGCVTHRDGLGHRVEVEPGDVSWMVTGRGLVHSERFDAMRAKGGAAHALVAFVALPTDQEQCAPLFEHFAADALPTIEAGAARGRLLLGSAYGWRAPATLRQDAYLIHWTLPDGAELTVGGEHAQCAVHTLSGAAGLDGRLLAAGDVAMIPAGGAALIARGPTALIEFGGAPVGERWLWWNFLASEEALIDAAKLRWALGEFPMPPGDRDDWIPLPADHERELRLLEIAPDD